MSNNPKTQAEYRQEIEDLLQRRVNIARHRLELHYTKTETAALVHRRDLETLTQAGYNVVKIGQKTAVLNVLLEPVKVDYYTK